MITAIQKMTDAANDLQKQSGRDGFGIFSIILDVTKYSWSGEIKVLYRAYQNGNSFEADTLEEAVLLAKNFNPKQAKRDKAAKLRAEADALEQEAK